MSMRRTYQIAGTLFLFFAVFMAYEALQLRYYTSMGPGPGFFSFWLALIFGGLAIAMILGATFGGPEPMPEDFFCGREGYLRIGAIILALVFSIFFLEKIGFPLTIIAVCGFLLRVLGKKGIFLTVLLSLVSGFGIYYVFDRLLKVPLPKGLLGF